VRSTHVCAERESDNGANTRSDRFTVSSAVGISYGRAKFQPDCIANGRTKHGQSNGTSHGCAQRGPNCCAHTCTFISTDHDPDDRNTHVTACAERHTHVGTDWISNSISYHLAHHLPNNVANNVADIIANHVAHDVTDSVVRNANHIGAISIPVCGTNDRAHVESYHRYDVESHTVFRVWEWNGLERGQGLHVHPAHVHHRVLLHRRLRPMPISCLIAMSLYR
jgi:hypothetical protein